MTRDAMSVEALLIENRELREALRGLVDAIDANDRLYPLERARALIGEPDA